MLRIAAGQTAGLNFFVDTHWWPRGGGEYSNFFSQILFPRATPGPSANFTCIDVLVQTLPYVPLCIPVQTLPYVPLCIPVQTLPYVQLCIPVQTIPYVPLCIPVQTLPYVPLCIPEQTLPYVPLCIPVQTLPYVTPLYTCTNPTLCTLL